jgi:undecaprenyl-diphosphatase
MPSMILSHAIILGIVQGLTEYLPISSSAHLTLIPWFTGWEDQGLSFDVALHWGTLVAVVSYFWADIIDLTKGAFGFLSGQRGPSNLLPTRIILATVPGAIIGFLFEKQAESIFRAPALIATNLNVLGIFLYLTDRFGAKRVSLSQLTWRPALLIGISQGLAIVPGVSRSGITISTALLLGLDRASAVRFSFYLSMPIIFGAGLLKIKYLAGNFGDMSLWAGLIAAAVSGFFAIQFLIGYIRTKSFTPFVIYRIVLSAAVFAWLYLSQP